MIKHPANITQESIKIGEFDKPQYFHYCVLQFKNMPSIVEQGQIIDCYLPNKNFLLIPRNILKRRYNNGDENITEHYFTSLLLIWEDTPLWGRVTESEVTKALETMMQKETNVRVQKTLVCDNGANNYITWTMPDISDFDANYSYLITHQYKNNKFEYRITCGHSFANTFEILEKHNIEDNTILDLVFTGRDTNDYHNTYNFNKYKIKDYRRIGMSIFLSNVKGLVEFDAIPDTGGAYVYLMSGLLDWKFPGQVKPNYYNGMSIKSISFIPEKLIETANNGGIYYKGNPLADSKTIELVYPANREVHKDMLREFFRKGCRAANSAWLGTRTSLEDIINKFDSGRIQAQIREWTSRKRDLVTSIAQSQREKRRLLEEILVIESRIQEFIPIPEIILPNRVDENNIIYDIFSILEERNGKYILEQKEEEGMVYDGQ